MSNILTTGYDSWKRDPEKMANNINAMLQYPNFLDLQKQVKSGKLSIPDAAEEMINRMQDNLEWLHDNMSPEFRQRARLWYDGTNTMAKRWAKQYGTTPEQAAGAMAVNSPKTEWFLNAERARRLVEFWKDRDSMQWDPRMGQAWRDKVSAAIPEEVRAQLYRRIQGKSFNDVRQEDRPVWFRLYDEAVNPKEYPTLTPEGKPGDLQRNNDGSPTAFSFAYLDHIAKSMSILEDGSKANIHAKLGLKHKVRNFFNNIINPNSARDHTTMDTHAVGAALLRPMSQKSLEVDQNFGGTGSSSSQISGEQGTYALYKEAYRRAAAARDLLPREMQSITWEGIRSMFSPEFKGPQANKAMIDSLWKDVSSGKITADEARERALQLGGGFDRPAWYPRGKWNTGLAEEPGSSGDSR
jgi:hypothetical protein